MGFRLGQLFLVVAAALAAMAVVAHSSDHHHHHNNVFIRLAGGSPADGGLVANALDGADEFMMESDTARRQLGGGRGYISYGAMRRNNVPCNRRGQSYYNCNSHQKANPYRRGCTRATHCARNNR
ncbi:hypothetical protein ABFX02_08G186100 [Erythranthe guttata]